MPTSISQTYGYVPYHTNSMPLCPYQAYGYACASTSQDACLVSDIDQGKKQTLATVEDFTGMWAQTLIHLFVLVVFAVLGFVGTWCKWRLRILLLFVVTAWMTSIAFGVTHVLYTKSLVGTAPLPPHTPKAVTYHEQSHYCGILPIFSTHSR